VAYVNRTDGGACLTIYTGNRSHGGRVRLGIIDDSVRRHHDGRVRLTNRITDRGIADVVVVGCASESPVVGSIGRGIGVHRMAHVYGADGGFRLAVHTRDR